MGTYSIYLESAKKIARDAGLMVKAHLNKKHNVQNKSQFDFVTEVDKMSEDMIRSYLIEQFPDHLFFGEESVSSSKLDEDAIIDSLPDDKYIWVVDPIDGTTNFIRGIPQFGISIALLYNKEVVVGVVYDISLERLFWTEKGGLSYCNNLEIKVSETSIVKNAIVATSFPASDLNARQQIMNTITEKCNEMTSLRIWNCASIAGISEAYGAIDVYFELGIHLWDFCAAMLIIQNAGGKFSDIDGQEFHMHQRNVLATNGILHDSFLNLIKL